jgi:3'-phosphoadenosine 5'-phosphosulfate sulfotransferase (PAPS reductase)/FAD synthetase
MNKIMSIDEMRQYEWSIGWSGGKDSTATIILCHEYNIPIKEIVYVRMMYDENTPATLPIMTDFVDNAKFIFESWGYNVNIIPSVKTAYELASAKFKRSKYTERNGKQYGVMAFMRGMCKLTDVKQKTLSNVMLSEYQMIGYAADEHLRLKSLSDTKQSIMVTLGINEDETFDICRRYNLLSPLYDLGTTRDGCWFCPNAKVKEREMIHKNYPNLVSKIDSMIEMCDYDIKGLHCRNSWVKDYFERNVTNDE